MSRSTNTTARGIHWFRNDLRLRDNTTLIELSDRVEEWLPVFVLDPDFMGDDPTRSRTRFLLSSLASLRADLEKRGVSLCVVAGKPAVELRKLVKQTRANVLSYGQADTPKGRRRDAQVDAVMVELGVETLCVRDHTVFGPDAIRTKADGIYSVYTPYRNRWWAQWADAPRVAAKRIRLPRRPIEIPVPRAIDPVKKLETKIAKRRTDLPALPAAGEAAARKRLASFLNGPVDSYATDRDRPAVDGTSRLSAYLRFGVLSARQCITAGLAEKAKRPASTLGVDKWLDEIVWREFYAMVLVQSPHVLTHNFRPEYDALDWSGSDAHFEAWCEGRTGYPFVDAGMRQLAQTGWMHNRVRMIVASFLTKDLLIDWRRGAEYFFDMLVDGDPASNNGGWQWAASTGTDAQPYFRIFNPVSQGEKWDPDGSYIRRFVPELREMRGRAIHSPWKAANPPADYPAPIVDHAKQRELALETYRSARAR